MKRRTALELLVGGVAAGPFFRGLSAEADPMVPSAPQALRLGSSGDEGSQRCINVHPALREAPACDIPFRGLPGIKGLTSIQPRIWISRLHGTEPTAVYVSAAGSTMASDDPEKDNPYQDIEFSWDFGDPDGIELIDNPVSHMPGQKPVVNANSDQSGPEAAYIYRKPGSYTITLTARARDEKGQLFVAKTTQLLCPSRWLLWMNSFSGTPTSGTFALTASIDGVSHTTPALPYNSWINDVVTALEALPHIGAGRVRPVRGSLANAPSLAGGQSALLNFEGDLAGKNVQLSITSSLDKGVYQLDRTPFADGASSNVLTVNRFAGRLDYFDSNYPGDKGPSDGSIDRPHTDLGPAWDMFRDGIGNRRIMIKRGSVFKGDYMFWGDKPLQNFAIMAYGDGPRPKIVSSHPSQPIMKFWPKYFNKPQNDIFVSGIEMHTSWPERAADQGPTGIFAFSYSNDPSANVQTQMTHLVLDDCYFGWHRRQGDGSQLALQTVQGSWHFLWRCEFAGAEGLSQQVMISMMQGLAVVGTTLGGGGPVTTSPQYYQTIYSVNGGHSLFRWVNHKPYGIDGKIGTLNLSIKLCTPGCPDGQKCMYHLVDGSYLGAGNWSGLALTTFTNSTALGIFDQAVFQNVHIDHPGRNNPTMAWGWNAESSMRVTVRDCWLSDAGLTSTGAKGNGSLLLFRNDQRSHLKFYRNRVHLPAPVNGPGQPAAEYGGCSGGYFCYNVIHKASPRDGSNRFATVQITSPNFSQWEIHDNIYFSPHPDADFIDRFSNNAPLSLAQMQTTYGIEQNSVTRDPQFVAPLQTIDKKGDLSFKRTVG